VEKGWGQQKVRCRGGREIHYDPAVGPDVSARVTRKKRYLLTRRDRLLQDKNLRVAREMTVVVAVLGALFAVESQKHTRYG
jgi:hypothetical protein